jgi:hypothetical protein
LDGGGMGFVKDLGPAAGQPPLRLAFVHPPA